MERIHREPYKNEQADTIQIPMQQDGVQYNKIIFIKRRVWDFKELKQNKPPGIEKKTFHETSDGSHRNKNVWRTKKKYRGQRQLERKISNHLNNFWIVKN